MDENILEKVYEITITNKTNIENIKEDIKYIKQKFDDYEKRIDALEMIKKYVVGSMALIYSMLATILFKLFFWK